MKKTYYHDKNSNDIHVLMESVEGDHREPYTWVKYYGEGRVFYTALGHDHQTWNQPEFLDLLKNEVLWAVKDEVYELWDQFYYYMHDLIYREESMIPSDVKHNILPH